jgi:hypothetical protein
MGFAPNGGRNQKFPIQYEKIEVENMGGRSRKSFDNA